MFFWQFEIHSQSLWKTKCTFCVVQPIMNQFNCSKHFLSIVHVICWLFHSKCCLTLCWNQIRVLETYTFPFKFQPAIRWLFPIYQRATAHTALEKLHSSFLVCFTKQKKKTHMLDPLICSNISLKNLNHVTEMKKQFKENVKHFWIAEDWWDTCASNYFVQVSCRKIFKNNNKSFPCPLQSALQDFSL